MFQTTHISIVSMILTPGTQRCHGVCAWSESVSWLVRLVGIGVMVPTDGTKRCHPVSPINVTGLRPHVCLAHEQRYSRIRSDEPTRAGHTEIAQREMML